MPDQPAPDFEEARRHSERIVQQIEKPNPEYGFPSSAEYNDARAYLALLGEREAREERDMELRRLLDIAIGDGPGAVNAYYTRGQGLPITLMDVRVELRKARELLALTATESAQAEPNESLEGMRGYLGDKSGYRGNP